MSIPSLRLPSRWSSRLLVASLLLAPLTLPVSEAQAAPATEAEMSLYTRIAAVNVCISRSAKVEFDTSVGIAGETIAQVIQGVHGGLIQQVGTKPLTIEEIRRGSTNSAVIGAVEICPNEVPAEVVKRVQDAIKEGNGGAQPAPR